jgi:hypothetical protein
MTTIINRRAAFLYKKAYEDLKHQEIYKLFRKLTKNRKNDKPPSTHKVIVEDF